MAAKIKQRKIKVAPYDSADYLKIEADIKSYLDSVFESLWIARCRFTR
jgi:DNA-binding phage protein